MESIIADSMKEFLQSHKIKPEQQHGFMSNKSILSNMLCCLNDWTKIIDNCCCVDVKYLDFSKAFDKVPKQQLIAKTEHVGKSAALDLPPS
ncbi:hypothetical protein JTB14_026409 [Gonioctena quinquepunctata]|nr:hypothetical protein JTB14_026409 [Gonioctena quinquepunctata]